MKTKYICEKCGAEYDTAESANKCEAVHGEIIEAHVMPGAVYEQSRITPNAVCVKFRNKDGFEAAAEYKFVKYKDKDFEAVKRESEE
ncbi:hypothetical protein [uncultured Megasphaera sp.]|uniref:hypothetical protein n=1 Tax=uncultured Megasphaera sp. TaxID=165188 RepID=UPI0025E881D8|nr:hypothetical protein [uncultured Megasphaera sp.]